MVSVYCMSAGTSQSVFESNLAVISTFSPVHNKYMVHVIEQQTAMNQGVDPTVWLVLIAPTSSHRVATFYSVVYK